MSSQEEKSTFFQANEMIQITKEQEGLKIILFHFLLLCSLQ